jgi:ABC-2 type transport system ATP-binding protein
VRIELRGVRKAFGKAEILRGIDLEIASGRRVALVGPNGSGKSTLLRAVLGLVGCEGQVLLDGATPFEQREELARHLAYVPQIAPQMSAPVREVVGIVMRTRDLAFERVEALASALALDLHPVLDRPFRLLSGGMKQKLLIALALAANASLLVLDEPTASLDADARDRFFKLISEAPAISTVLLCSHRLEELRHLAEDVVELADGKVVYDGSIEQLLGARGMSTIEVYADADHGAWLLGRGFHAGAPGWWARTFTRDEKLRVIPELIATLGAGLRDLVVRDLESIGTADAARTAPGGIDDQEA